MGILNNTVSISQFQLIGAAQNKDLVSWVGDGLAKNRFRSIEQTSEELSIGWVQLNDYQDSEFNGAHTYHHDHYFAFALRIDQRKLPQALLKPYVLKAEEQWLAENPQFNRVPKKQREDLRDAVRGSLFAKSLPSPAIYDAVWDTRSNLVSFCSLSTRAIDQFVDLFNKSFAGLRLVPLHPMARAARVVDASLKPALDAANASSSGNILEQIDSQPLAGRRFSALVDARNDEFGLGVQRHAGWPCGCRRQLHRLSERPPGAGRQQRNRGTESQRDRTTEQL